MDRVFTDQIDSNGKPWDVDDGLVDKYRVFRIMEEPTHDSQGAMEAVESFVFVLKPNHDHHARVALSAYAASCAIDKPQLSKDLYDLLSQDEWGSD